MDLRPGYKQTEIGPIPEDWDAVPLGDLFTFKNGLNKAKKYFGYGTPIVNYMDVFRHPGLRLDRIEGLVDVSKSELEAFEVRKGDVFFTRTSETVEEIGVAAAMLDPAKDTVFSGFVLRARPTGDRLDDLFKAYCFSPRYFRRQVVARATYTTRALTNGRSLSAAILAVPPAAEQQAIAQALFDIDSSIANLARLIAKKRDLRTGAMQRLLAGKTRLPGFAEPWKTKLLAELGKCLRGVTYDGDADLFQADNVSSIRLLRANNVQAANIRLEGLQFVNRIRVSADQKLRAFDIVICTANGSRALVGKSAIFNVSDGHDYTFGAFMGCFRSYEDVADPVFLHGLLNSERFAELINIALSGSTINNLSPRTIEGMEFLVPDIEEQRAVARVLSDMDAEITALEARLEKTRALKQGMMQALLTGRVRLPVRSEALDALEVAHA